MGVILESHQAEDCVYILAQVLFTFIKIQATFCADDVYVCGFILDRFNNAILESPQAWPAGYTLAQVLYIH